MTFRLDLFEALREQLEGVDLFLGPLPQSGTGIGVSFYDVDPPDGSTDSVEGVQLTIRHDARNDARATLLLADGVFQILHGQSVTDWAGIPIHHVWRNSSADLGPDESGRRTQSDNYYVRCSRTGAHLSDT